MLGMAAALASVGIDFVKDLITDNGEDLVIEGIKKVTGIDLNKKKHEQLSKEDIALINAHKLEIEKLDFQKLRLELDKQRESNRHEETKYSQAHQTYQGKSNMADVIAKQIVERNLPIIGLLVLINVLLVYFLQENATLIAIASNIIGIAVGNLFAERQAIVNFFFGSSIGSKEKDNLLKQSQSK